MRGRGRDLFPSEGKANQSRFSKQKARTTVETVFELVKKALEGRILTCLGQIERGTVLDHAVMGVILDQLTVIANDEVGALDMPKNV